MTIMPRFVMTSEGLVNLDLVAQIGMRSGQTCFTFLGSVSGGEEGMEPNYVTVPVEEGKEIVARVQETCPEFFEPFPIVNAE
jgi:hypothetical protein